MGEQGEVERGPRGRLKSEKPRFYKPFEASQPRQSRIACLENLHATSCLYREDQRDSKEPGPSVGVENHVCRKGILVRKLIIQKQRFGETVGECRVGPGVDTELCEVFAKGARVSSW